MQTIIPVTGWAYLGPIATRAEMHNMVLVALYYKFRLRTLLLACCEQESSRFLPDITAQAISYF